MQGMEVIPPDPAIPCPANQDGELSLPTLLLEQLAAGHPLDEPLTTLCCLLEERFPGSLYGIWRHDLATERWQLVAGPSLTSFCQQEAFPPDVGPGLYCSGSFSLTTSDGRILGAMRAYRPQPQPLTTGEHHSLQAAAHLVQIALHKQQTQEELRQQTEFSARIHAINLNLMHRLNLVDLLIGSITLRIRSSFDLPTIFQGTVEQVQELLQADRVVFYRFAPHPAAQGLVVVAEATVAPVTAAHLDPATLARSAMTVPVMDRQELTGILVVQQWRSVRLWRDFEVDLLEQLAAQAGIAIQQAELLQTVQTLNVNLEQQVQHRTRQLQQALSFESTLKRITDKVRDSLDEQQILQTAVQELVGILAVAGCDVGLYDPDNTHSLITCEHVDEMPSALGQKVEMAAAPEYYAQLLHGVHFQYSLYQVSLTRSLKNHYLTVLACPVMDDQGVVGDLHLFRAKGQTFEEAEIRLVQQVANQCAIGIRQARLYQSAQMKLGELEQLNLIKDDILNTVSHELRTPLSNMRMAIAMLRLSSDEQRRQRYLHILEQECERETELINDLLDLQRLESGGREPNYRLVVLQDQLPTLLDPFQTRAEVQSQQRLQVAIASDLPPLFCDWEGVRRIVNELLNNACKYSAPQSLIRFAAHRDGQWVRIEVNNPAEIPAADLPRIFDKFYRATGVDRWKQGGTGLGLALVRRLVQQMQGSIAAQSQSGSTTFTVRLPLRPDPVDPGKR